ncbi:hypothetical protein GbCGDNIH2_7076 [Granulibacter bethesdensis]|uniref:Uncharacterized protein n=1 Tax=Granulibacter bethesdensis (strain ATCC BAA-1260 / CGDNIH1) TaxID=391165 RepID=A0A286M372_GRABC|nr:hypothetical protein GbCGDNIH2_7076 [Granulibacter bethesdensis]APH52651.1 hypothetical protein GbCGDNIH5_7076 [Granulibacter bethesdensis]APH65340.1 hypothetical protein GbCGDNIH1I4_7076 [Granulibacter bethesdensis]ASV62471.1 hypothetical protein GbCGDNIH1_7076 [Granulibacter bethesdensis CGDNIH1]
MQAAGCAAFLEILCPTIIITELVPTIAHGIERWNPECRSGAP